MRIDIQKHLLHFKIPSGTSRGVLNDKPSWILSVNLPNGKIAQGECSVIPGLSPDFIDEQHYEGVLSQLQLDFRSDWVLDEFQHEEIFQSPKWKSLLVHYQSYPSIIFGIETLARSVISNGSGMLFDTAFSRKEESIAINGLIWMGDDAFMSDQIEEKLAAGFTTIKMKVGAIEWDKERALLVQLRTRFSSKELTLRVDANGAFTPETALPILNQLGDLQVHSIEQPIRAGQVSEMHRLCAASPIGIALDEEMIGIHEYEHKEHLLNAISPQFIVLKPSLHGGFQGCREWIQLAEKNHISWWMTSALESSIGLNAIAQFTSTFKNNLPQGLGTGGLYTNNFESLLVVQNGQLMMR